MRRGMARRRSGGGRSRIGGRGGVCGGDIGR